ncbi:hypothetical protein DZC72_01065 [Maribacter algicola]|uniref:Efflux RND transporter periplasmic adaptor subunit n=1 Tax=Maribacter algicola TaxID=2498892 RepID=A0A426RJP5_9FLAO|nr:hypothetical protein [Maribacter algicola]RRQ49246.1 hypothetical protein DZC72_01065 [Maribacter algicola]
MKIRLFKFPSLALLVFVLLIFSTSCNKETDLVSEFVIKDSVKVIDQNSNEQLVEIEAVEGSN